ncbi:MAG: hypothetical protein RLZZ09_2972 [Pseudomonadota bacterium]|jgi:hypothetical protein
MLYRYQVYGLTLESEIECPELAPAPAGAAVDVRIRLGHVEPELEGSVKVGHRVLAAPGIYQIWVEGVARFRAYQGQYIWIDPVPGVDARDIRAYLLGAVLGITVLLRGLLPLHACAVEVNGEAVAFCGDSGAGKSTLAAALYQRGYPMLADDLGVLLPEDGGAIFYPGFPRIKLWRDSLEYFALDHKRMPRDFTRAEKFHWHLDGGHKKTPLKLNRLYVLGQSPDEQILIQPMQGSTALASLMANTFGAKFVSPFGMQRVHLFLCAEVVDSIEVFSYRRPWRLAGLEGAVLKLIGHLQGVSKT